MRFPCALLVTAICMVMTEVPFAQDPVKLSPKMYTVLLENEHVRVLEFRCKPGEKEPVHSHPTAVAYPLIAGKAKATTPDGKTTESDGKPGTAVWVEPITHSWECLSEGRVIITELKGVKPAGQKK